MNKISKIVPIHIGIPVETEKYIYWTEDDELYERFCDRDLSNGIYLDDKWRSILNRTRKIRYVKSKKTRKLYKYETKPVKLYTF